MLVSSTSSIYTPNRPDHPPLGRQQYDRIRALASELKKEKNIYALGVVGTDVYDKIVVLEALKSLLPGTIFFSTDLDNIYSFQNYANFTQNLLVATSYGFNFNTTFQGNSIPFRDTYQTATFSSMLAILNRKGTINEGCVSYNNEGLFDLKHTPQLFLDWKADNSEIPGFFLAPEPQVYEITRDGARLLTTQSPHTSPLGDMMPLPNKGYRNKVGLIFVLWMILLAIIAWWPYDLRRFGRNEYTLITIGSIVASVAALACSAVLLYSFWHCALSPDEEQFGWMNGASLWPTEMIRVVVIVLAIRYIEYSFCIVRRELDRVRVCVDSLPELGKDFIGPLTKQNTIWNLVSTILENAALEIYKAEKVDGKDSCGDVTHGAKMRVTLLSIVLILIAIGVNHGFEASLIPSRGITSYAVDFVLRWIELVIFCILLAECCYLTKWAADNLILPLKDICNPDTSHIYTRTANPTPTGEIIIAELAVGFYLRVINPDSVWARDFMGYVRRPTLQPLPTVQVQMLELISGLVGNAERLVLCPFCLLLFILLSQSRIFDGWPLAPSFVAMCLLASFAMVVMATRLRSTFGRLRNRVRRNIAAANLNEERESKAQLPAETLLSRIDGIGELDSIWNNPVLSGLAIVLTGAGGSQLLSMLFR